MTLYLKNSSKKLLTSNFQTHSTLPVALGGLGVRSAIDLSPPAFLFSVYACSPHVRKLLLNFYNILDDSYYNSAKGLYSEKIGSHSCFPGNPMFKLVGICSMPN